MVAAITVGVGYGYFILSQAVEAVGRQVFADEPLPDLAKPPLESTKIYDRQGNLIYQIGSSRREAISIDQVPQSVVNAFLAAEDRTFYTNPGFSIKSLIRAAHVDVREDRILQGGSTITQQLAQQLVVSKENTIWRKVKEILISVVMTRHYSKDEILERYLNEVPVGGELVGLGAASREYFGKDVADLSMAQGAYIAALINAPSTLDPYANYDGLTARQRVVLGRMKEFGFINNSEYQAAISEEVAFNPRRHEIKHPYFSFYVRNLLEQQFGQEIVNEGLTVQTSLDAQAQEMAEQLVAEHAQDGLDEWDASNASLLATNPQNGQILAYVGGADFTSSQVDMNTSPRQPGSTIKPLIYYTAFAQGYSPETLVLDMVEDFGGGYRPTNYGGTSSGRYVRLDQALAGSLNIPAVRVLRGVGMDNALANLKLMGFPVVDGYNYTLPLALGAVEVTPMDMTQAFAVLANQGKQVRVSPLLKVVDRSGKVLLDNTDISTGEQVLDLKAVTATNYVISDYTIKQRLYGGTFYNNYTLKDRPVAAKTGTSSGPKDTWMIGYTPSLLTTVWAGNTSGEDLHARADGINVAAPLWNKFMTQATQGQPVEEFAKYESEPVDQEHRFIDRLPITQPTSSPSPSPSP